MRCNGLLASLYENDKPFRWRITKEKSKQQFHILFMFFFVCNNISKAPLGISFQNTGRKYLPAYCVFPPDFEQDLRRSVNFSVGLAKKLGTKRGLRRFVLQCTSILLVYKCFVDLRVHRRAKISRAYTCICFFMCYTKNESLATWVPYTKFQTNTTYSISLHLNEQTL